MPTLAFGDWRPDIVDYQQEHSQTITNVVPRGDGYGPIRQVQAFSSALDDVCRGIYLANDSDGSVVIFAGTASKLYRMDNTDLSWADVTRVAGGNYTVANTDQWQFVQFGLDVIAVNQNDPPQRYTIGTSTNFVALAGSPPQAQFVTVVGNHLVLSGLLNTPNGIAWSALNDIEGWIAGTDGSDIQSFEDGGAVLAVAGGEHGVLFQTKCIRRIDDVGGETIFEFHRIVEGEGLAAKYSVIRAGPAVFFYGTSGFQVIMSGQFPLNLSKERWFRTFQAEYDDTEEHMMIGSNSSDGRRVWWFYKSKSGGSTSLFNRAIVYDWAIDKASYVTGITGEYAAPLSQPGVTLDGLDALGFSNLDTMLISLDDFVASGIQLLAIVDSTHSFGFLTGDTLEATLDTADYSFGNRFFVRAQRPITDADTVWGSVSTRARIAETPVYSEESEMNDVGFCPHRADTRMARFRLRIPAGTDWTYATGTEPEAVGTGMQ